MSTPKISMDELRAQFDNDVERFSDEKGGQATSVDAPLVLDMVERTIFRMQPNAQSLCDIGCGAGNFSLRIARKLPKLNITLVDLSRPMLDRAVQRLQAEKFNVAKTIQGDINEIRFDPSAFDVVVASASLHHLRTRDDWKKVFRNIFESLRPGGAFWICDLVKHENGAVETVQKERYADYLTSLQDKAFQERVFDFIDRSDSPETVKFLMQTLHGTGFVNVDIVHKNTVFVAMVARRPG